MSATAQLCDDCLVLSPDKRGQTSLFNSTAQGPWLCGRAASTSQHPTLHVYSLHPARGPWHRLAELWKGKTSFRSVRAQAKQGLQANSVETLAAQYSQWFGRSRGEEVKPGEGTEKTPREERRGGQSECCRYYTTGKRQLYLENTSSVLLVVTEEAGMSSCPSSLAGKQQITHLF